MRLENKGIAVTLRVRERVLRRNGIPVQMDVAPVLRQNRVFLPARFVAEAFGCSVAWDGAAKAVYVYPVRIDWEAAKNGTLQPSENAKQPPDKWGFPAKAVRMEFKVGNRYAKVTRADGSTYQLDLGAPCVVAGNPVGVEFLRKKYPGIYNSMNSIPLPGADFGALYIPFIPVAEAFGVPRENIVWDGQHLAVFGWDAVDGCRDGYLAFKAGSKESLAKWHTGEVTVGHLEFPLFVKDGVPMMGINSVSDFDILFRAPGDYCAIVNLWPKTDGGWDYETGIAAETGEL